MNIFGRHRWLITFLLLLGLACHGCSRSGSIEDPNVDAKRPGDKSPPPAADPWFVDATKELGLDFVHDPGPITKDYFMPQSMGSGLAVFDFDGDGRLDLYFLQNAGPKSSSKNRLYRQTAEGRFEDVSKGSGLDVAGYGMGVAAGDVNNDGRPDVCVAEYGRVRLFLNEGDGKFRDVTKAAGISNPQWASVPGFLDYDRDGFLDLVIVNYIEYDPAWDCSTNSGRPDYCAPYAFQGTASQLFHHLGPGDGSVRFEDVTVSSGVGTRAGPGLGVLCSDFNRDGWIDIFIGNDGKANHLWINRQDGTFAEEAILSGLAYNAEGKAEADMGIGWGDANGDLLPDLFVTHLTEETHTFWVQESPGVFQDRTAASHLTAADWHATGFGATMQDFDHDGALDIASVSGRVSQNLRAKVDPKLGSHWSFYAERNQLFAGDGRGHFRDVSRANPPFCGTPNVARGLAWGDIDGDGDVDLVITTAGGKARIFRNVAASRGHWLIVQALDPQLHRNAYGAEVTIVAGEHRKIGYINPGGSFGSSSDPRAHFGLGNTTRIDRIEVRWPDGTLETFPGGEVDRMMTLKAGTGDVAKTE